MMSDNKELLDYMDYIHRLAKNKVEKEFTNSGPNKASIVFNELFSNSEKEFRLYAGNLLGEVSSKILYLSGLRKFLQKKNNSLKILVEDVSKITKNNELFKLLTDFKSKVTIRKSEVNVLDNGEKIHFSIGDGVRYRKEIDQTNFIARGSFNDANEASKLKSLFDDIYNSEEYSSSTNLLK